MSSSHQGLKHRCSGGSARHSMYFQNVIQNEVDSKILLYRGGFAGTEVQINTSLELSEHFLDARVGSRRGRLTLELYVYCGIPFPAVSGYKPLLSSFQVNSFIYLYHNDPLPLSFQQIFETGSQIRSYSTRISRSYRSQN